MFLSKPIIAIDWYRYDSMIAMMIAIDLLKKLNNWIHLQPVVTHVSLQ